MTTEELKALVATKREEILLACQAQSQLPTFEPDWWFEFQWGVDINLYINDENTVHIYAYAVIEGQVNTSIEAHVAIFHPCTSYQALNALKRSQRVLQLGDNIVYGLQPTDIEPEGLYAREVIIL